jgi:hypothetical protein
MTPDTPDRNRKPEISDLPFHEGERGFDTHLNAWFEIISIDIKRSEALLRYDCGEEEMIPGQCPVTIDYIIRNCGFGVEDDERAKYEKAKADSLDTADGPKVAYDDPRFKDETGPIARDVKACMDRTRAN